MVNGKISQHEVMLRKNSLISPLSPQPLAELSPAAEGRGSPRQSPLDPLQMCLPGQLQLSPWVSVCSHVFPYGVCVRLSSQEGACSSGDSGDFVPKHSSMGGEGEQSFFIASCNG